MLKKLFPIRHPQRDFFIADIFDGLPYKDDMASMEHPFFNLSTQKDLRVINYEYNGNTISISPSVKVGLPTIFDKDVLLYCGSLLMAEIKIAKDTGRELPPKKLRISSHDLLVATNRHTNDNGYKLLALALERLKGVSITTNIKTNKIEIREGFGLIDRWKIIESSRVKGRMIKLEITLSDWFYNSLLGNNILTISHDYFRLRKPLERRLYEIARKHCGQQDSWDIGIDKLYVKTGSRSSKRKFRFFIKKISKTNHLPDYQLNCVDDKITFTNRGTVQDTKETDTKDYKIPPLHTETFDKARRYTEGFDIYALESEWRYWSKDRPMPDNPDAAFIGFCKQYRDTN